MKRNAGEGIITGQRYHQVEDVIDPMQWLRRLMVGRHGTDSLNLFLFIVALLLVFLSFFTHLLILHSAATLILAGALFRSLSRNIYQRNLENQFFLQHKARVVNKFLPLKTKWQQRKTHRFYKCKSCQATLRVPKGRGRMIVTCPKCHSSFERKT